MQWLFFTTGDFMFDLSSIRPARPPYTGTLLPAVIHTFNFQVDIEEAETQRLSILAEALEQELASMSARGNSACTGLEPKRPELVKSLTRLSAQLRALHAEIQDLDAAYVGTDDSMGDIGDTASSSKQERELNESQSKFKAATSEVKKLHRKIMMLSHEERQGKNPILREIFDLANAARKDNDVRALEELLDAAKKYHRSASDRRSVLDFLKQKRQAFANMVKEMETKRIALRRSAPYTVHTLLEQGKVEEALSVFTSILENARGNLQDQINIARMKLRHIQDQRKQKADL